MNIFENLIKIDQNDNLFYNYWIEWDHFAIPNKPEWFREFMRHLFAIMGHCLNCTALDGCYFLYNNCPTYPLHKKCDCKKNKIIFNKVKDKANTLCDINKFTKYIFTNKEKSKGKNKVFTDLGFSIGDSQFLQQYYCIQALKQYLLGNYKLKNLDARGQRLAIPIILNNKKIYTGWMMYPEGILKNTTPFGGFVL